MSETKFYASKSEDAHGNQLAEIKCRVREERSDSGDALIDFWIEGSGIVGVQGVEALRLSKVWCDVESFFGMTQVHQLEDVTYLTVTRNIRETCTVIRKIPKLHEWPKYVFNRSWTKEEWEAEHGEFPPVQPEYTPVPAPAAVSHSSVPIRVDDEFDDEPLPARQACALNAAECESCQ